MSKRIMHAVVVAGAFVLCGAVSAQPSQDASAAPPGNYAIDARHTAVLARIPHMGFSYSVFRFGGVNGQLVWNAASPSADALTISINTASIQTPVPGFSEELSGPNYLNATQFPTATFVSTSFRRIDPTHGQVDGVFTFKGVSKPLTFNVQLIGAGVNAFGKTVLGVHAEARIDNSSYQFPQFITGQTELEVDAEFDKQN